MKKLLLRLRNIWEWGKYSPSKENKFIETKFYEEKSSQFIEPVSFKEKFEQAKSIDNLLDNN